MRKKTVVQKIELPRICYKYSTGYDQIVSEFKDDKTKSEVSEIIWGNFTGFKIKDAQFPYKVVTSPDILFSANMCKSVFIESIKLFNIFFIFLPVEKVIDSFNRLCFRIMSPHILKDEYMTTFSRELQFAIFTFLINIKIPEEKAIRCAEIFVHLIEYDNAYRLRLVDIISETNKHLLTKNPRKEIKRLLKIIVDREKDNYSVSRKIILLINLITFILLIPKYKKAFRKMVDDIDIRNLQYDDIDLYWTAVRTDYKFWGMEKEDRKLFVTHRGWGYPENLW